jgi:hypothetical protein
LSFAGWAALVTCLVSFVLCASLGLQYLERRRTYQLWWSVAFLVAALASLLQVVAFADGVWPALAYRGYVVFSAPIPGLMGAGSVFLLYRRFGPYFAAVIIAAALVTLWGAAGALHPVDMRNVLEAGAQVTKTMPSWQVATGFAVLGALGAAALVLGAAWSWLRTRQHFNLGIVFGGLVFSVADSLSALNGPAAAYLFFAAEVVGAVALYMAVRAAGMRRAPASDAATAPAPRHA